MNILKDIEPKRVFSFFEELTKIPHGSGNEKEISDYIYNFAKERNLDVYQDAFNNLIIKKKGSKGYENSIPVILQGHIDMVCEKNNDTEHDFEKDPLKLKINEDFIEAEGTTLGADNGIGVAYAMSILDDEQLEHPPLEVVLTADEEVGMGGASNLDMSLLKGKYMINLDSEDEGTLIVGCAGGGRVYLSVPIEKEIIDKEDIKTFDIQVRGLKGGHSGAEITKNRGNSNKIMGRILFAIKEKLDFNIVSINGGAKDNAIPREMDVQIITKAENEKQLIEVVNEYNKIIKNESKVSDPDVSINIKNIELTTDKCFTKSVTFKIVNLLNVVKNGIQTMSAEIEGLPQSSLNLGVITTDEKEVVFTFALRSSVKTLYNQMENELKIYSEIFEVGFKSRNPYPAWEYKQDSRLRDLFKEVYLEMYNKEVKIEAIHAGLECGIFASQIEGLDIVALGPDMADIHTPDERLSISSTKRVYEYVVNVLKKLK